MSYMYVVVFLKPVCIPDFMQRVSSACTQSAAGMPKLAFLKAINMYHLLSLSLCTVQGAVPWQRVGEYYIPLLLTKEEGGRIIYQGWILHRIW